jgi:hypothetical protein
VAKLVHFRAAAGGTVVGGPVARYLSHAARAPLDVARLAAAAPAAVAAAVVVRRLQLRAACGAGGRLMGRAQPWLDGSTKAGC